MMKSTLRKCLCLAALASAAFVAGSSDASACHRSGCGVVKMKCFAMKRCRTTCAPVVYQPTCYTYAYAPTYAPAPAPVAVYGTPQAPPKSGMVPPPPPPSAVPAK